MFAATDSVSVGIATAIIAGVFSLLNTFLTFAITRKVKRMHKKQNRTLELVGERESDKHTTEVGQNPPTVVIEKDRREH